MRMERVPAQQRAALLAMFANAHRDPRKGRPLRLEDFDPYARQRRTDGEADDLTALREMFRRRQAGEKAGAKAGRDAGPETERPSDGTPEPAPAPASEAGPGRDAEPVSEGAREGV